MNKIRRNHTYLTGILLAVNAIKRSYLLIDGPDCTYKKIESIEKNHDFFTKLFRQDGKHVFGSTVADVKRVIHDRMDQLEHQIIQFTKQDGAEAVFLSSLPMASLTGVDYNLFKKKIATKKPIINLPYKSLDKDWLDGYADTQKAIAKEMEFSKEKKQKHKIGIVGYMFDRNEGDHKGNITEMKRWMEALGLELVSVWFDGRNYSDLHSIEEAGLIISLPYAREAARIITEKTGAKLLKLGLPMGFDGTRRWIRAVAEETNTKEKAEAFIDEELRQCLPVLEWVVPEFFQQKKVSLIGDPYLMDALSYALEELDVEINELILFSTPDRKDALTHCKGKNFYFDLDDPADSRPLHFAIGNSDGSELYSNVPYIEFGYPSYGYHAFFTQPFLGFKGFLIFINRLVNRMEYDIYRIDEEIQKAEEQPATENSISETMQQIKK
ncbi:MAG: nitrogenase component 1 [Nanoarchaeota archaeon]